MEGEDGMRRFCLVIVSLPLRFLFAQRCAAPSSARISSNNIASPRDALIVIKWLLSVFVTRLN